MFSRKLIIGIAIGLAVAVLLVRINVPIVSTQFRKLLGA